MIPRRSLVTGGVLGGVLGVLGAADDSAAAAPSAAVDVNDEMVSRIVRAITGLGAELQALKSFSDIAPVRETQLTYLRANSKFPDFIEVGTSTWFAVHDWHVRWLQPLSLGRDALGRYTIAFNQTTLILRSDAAPNFMGVPYDNR
jgi:hypothetical protein